MNLNNISLIISLIGIFLLLIISNLNIKIIPISEINLFQNKIKIKGNITRIINYPEFQIIEIKDSTGKINAILNKKSFLNKLDLNLNQEVIIIGNPSKYKNKIQIYGKKIILP